MKRRSLYAKRRVPILALVVAAVGLGWASDSEDDATLLRPPVRLIRAAQGGDGPGLAALAFHLPVPLSLPALFHLASLTPHPAAVVTPSVATTLLRVYRDAHPPFSVRHLKLGHPNEPPLAS